MNTFYVYILYDLRKPWNPETDFFGAQYQPFYVGKGIGRRYLRHKSTNSSNPHKDRVISCLQTEGYSVREYSKIVLVGLSEEDAHRFESILIRHYKRVCDEGILVNLTLGGEGSVGHKSKFRGKKLEEIVGVDRAGEIRKKLSVSASIREYSNKGKTISTHGKTYDEIYGIEISNKLKSIRSTQRAGKNFEELYGKEKANKMKKQISEQQSGKLSIHAKRYIITDVAGLEHDVIGLRQFCRERNLSHAIMSRIANNLNSSRFHKGWTCRHFTK